MYLQKKGEKNAIDKKLMMVANEINKVSPVMVDSITRFDNSIALPGNKLQYNFTLLNTEKETTDTTILKSSLDNSIHNLAKSDPRSQLFRESKVVLIYSYRDKNGAYLFRITVNPDEFNM